MRDTDRGCEPTLSGDTQSTPDTPAKADPTVGVVIPAFEPDVDQLRSYIDSICDTIAGVTVRVELDSPDQATIEGLTDSQATVNTTAHRRGKGAALTAGFDALDTDILAFSDADASTSATELDRIIEVVRTKEADLAVGSRRHPETDEVTTQSPYRAYMGHGFAWLARRVLDISLYDYQCGAKALTRDTWLTVRRYIQATGFAWDIELVAYTHAVGAEIDEIPITWHDAPKSTVPPIRTAVAFLGTLGRTWYRTRGVTEATQTRPVGPESGLSSQETDAGGEQ